MVNVIAATSFFGTTAEGMWRAGDTRRVSAHRANELIEEGLAIESQDQSEPAKLEPSALQQAADAIGATVGALDTAAGLQAVADELGATVKTDADEIKPVTTESTKQKAKPGADRETKPAHGPAETK